MSADPSTLMNDARCINSCVPAGMQLPILINLAASIVTAGSGLNGSGSPEGVVTANPGTTYFDTASAIFWVKQTGTGNTGWYQLVGP